MSEVSEHLGNVMKCLMGIDKDIKAYGSSNKKVLYLRKTISFHHAYIEEMIRHDDLVIRFHRISFDKIKVLKKEIYKEMGLPLMLMD